MSENSDKYQRAVNHFSEVVDSVKDWNAPSPCEGWTAKHVVGHVMGGMEMVSTVKTGQAPDFSDPDAKAGEDPPASYAAARDLALSTLTDEHLATVIPSPFGEMPLDQMIGMILTNDVLIHTWDLAKAAGLSIKLDEELVEAAYLGLQPLDAMVRSESVFGPKVDVPDHADLQSKLIAFTGRQPD